jgi:hypothetical protein
MPWLKAVADNFTVFRQLHPTRSGSARPTTTFAPSRGRGLKLNYGPQIASQARSPPRGGAD